MQQDRAVGGGTDSQADNCSKSTILMSTALCNQFVWELNHGRSAAFFDHHLRENKMGLKSKRNGSNLKRKEKRTRNADSKEKKANLLMNTDFVISERNASSVLQSLVSTAITVMEQS